MGRRPSLGGDGEPVPDDLRCRRSDGKSWRCPLRASSGVSFCEHHYRQARRNVACAAKTNRISPSPMQDNQIAVKWRRRKMRRTKTAISLQLDTHVRVKVKEVRARSEEKGLIDEAVEDSMEKVVIDLPNGVMAISPASQKELRRHADPLPYANIALGFNDDDLHSRRRLFRSKTLKPNLIESILRLPGTNFLGRKKKKILRECLTSKTACRFCFVPAENKG